MTPRTSQHESKSIKTFVIYTSIVIFFIILSLAVKSFFIMQQNRFDSDNQFILSLEHDTNVQELAIINPAEHSVAVFKLHGVAMGAASLEKTLGILPDAFVNSTSDFSLSDIKDTVRSIAFHYHTVKTNLTIFDVVGLFLASQHTSFTNQEEKNLEITNDIGKNDQIVKNLFTDERIFSENISIEIINSSGIPGVGKRLERVLTNLGGNVVAVSSSRKEENISRIQYFGPDTYTLNKLKKLLAFPTEKIEKKSIATIVITVGSDITKSSNFH